MSERRYGTVERQTRIDSFDLPSTGEGVWQGVTLSEKPNGYGGNQVFFLCPYCGKRVRYLYFVGGLRCRKCAGLNYRSNQRTRDSFYYQDKGMELALKRLKPYMTPDALSFDRWLPDKPKGMHKTTYQKYLRRFRIYQEKRRSLAMAELFRIIR